MRSVRTPCKASRVTTSATLAAARNLIADEKRWTQEANARTSAGVPCAPEDPEAVCWDPTGAIVCVALRLSTKKHAYDLLAEVVKPLGIGKFNDTHKHREVLAAFDRAIGLAVREEEA